MARSLGVLLVLVLAGHPSASAARGAAGEEPSRTVIRVTVPRVGISVAYPSNWQMRSKRLNGVVGPITRFTVTSFPLRQSRPDPDFCARTLNDQWPATGVWMQLTEELDGASLKRLLRRVPPRPRRFRLLRSGAGGLCTRAVSGQLTFHERGRAFYLYYGVGTGASAASRRALVALFNSLRVGR